MDLTRERTRCMAEPVDLSTTHDVPHRHLLTVAGVAGIAYTLSWIAALAVTAGSPAQLTRRVLAMG